MHDRTIRRILAAALASAAMTGTAFPAAAAQAQDRARHGFDIPAQDVAAALEAFGRQSGKAVMFNRDRLTGARSRAVRGNYPADQALSRLLAGTGLTFRAASANAYVVETPGPREIAEEHEGLPADIVVTAQKRREALKEVPLSVTALRGEDLARRQQRSFADYASSVPGLSLESQGPGVTRVTLRGLNAGGVGSTVAIYVDESPFGSSTALLNGGSLAGDIDTWDLQRVEVLSGPQGTLYGANAQGGLIKFVANTPDTSGFEGAAELAWEAIKGGDSGLAVRGMVNLPLGDSVAVRVSGFEQKLPGFIDNTLLGNRDINGGRKFGGRAAILLKPTETLSVTLTAMGQQTRYGGTYVIDTDPVTLEPGHGDLVQQRYLRENMRFRYQNYNGTANWDLGAVTLISTTSYGILDARQPIDFSSIYALEPITYREYLTDYLFGEPLALGLLQNINLKKFTQEVRLASAASDRLEWQVGGYYTHEKAYLNQLFTGYILGTQTPSPNLPLLQTLTLSSTYSEYAGFANATLKLSPAFDVRVGGRYSDNRQEALEVGDGYFFGGNPISFTAKSVGKVFTYSVAPRWTVNRDLMVYARVASGFRPGGPNILPPMADPAVPRQYDADTTTNYELGVRSTLFGGRLSLDLTAFLVDWDHIQLLQIVQNTGVNANGGKARSQGIEWNIAAVPVKGLTFKFVGAYTDAKLTTSSTASIEAVAGSRLPFVSKWSQSVDAEYSFPVFSSYSAYIGGRWSYVGDRYSGFDLGGQKLIPHYDTIDLRLGLQGKRYSGGLYIKNAGNSRGLTSYGSGVIAPDQLGSASIVQPRTIGLSLSGRF
jgi:iron complex outermembrane receptor protein